MFAANLLDFKEVDVFGFDYDYTLANYETSVEYLIYELARDVLVDKYKASCDAFLLLISFLFVF